MMNATGSTVSFEELAHGVATLSLRVVALAEPLHFGLSPARDLDLLRTLRAATSHAVRLRWILRGLPSFPLETYAHLLPPVGGVGAEEGSHAQRWAGDYRYGSFHYRRGPGLITIKDTRPGQPASRMIISEGAERFESLAESPDGRPGAGDWDLVADAVEAGLIMEAEGNTLVLPFRMRHWPVPYLAI